MCDWQGLDKEGIKEKVSEILGIDGEFIVDPLPGDASTRRFYRIKDRGGTRSLVLMRLEKPEKGELDFINIQRYLVRCGIDVPGLYLYDEEEGILFLEDLGDKTLEKRVIERNGFGFQDLYIEALDTLIHLQSATSRQREESCAAYQRSFDVEKLMQELDMFLEYAPRLYKKRIREADRKAIRDDFYSLCSIIANKEIFCHRDYHSRNIIFHNGRIKLVDFQDARLGPAQYDLASLLFDSYVVLDEEMREDLLLYYLKKSGINQENFRMVFDYTSIQRNLKACGTFAYLGLERRRICYTEYIPDTLRYVSRNLSRYPEFNRLKETLGRYLKEVE